MNSEYLKIVGAVVLPNLGGIIGSRYVNKHNLESWYSKLKFPSFRPPNWVFAPVWTTLYSGIGYASYMVYKDGGGLNNKTALPLAAYIAQLGLNWAWTPLFFGQHNIKGGLIDIVALTGAASITGILFYRINNTAGFLFVPYLAWLGFATMLTYSIYKLNPDEKEK